MSKKQAIYNGLRGASKNSDKRCSNCKWYLKNNSVDGNCQKFNFIVDSNALCNQWVSGYSGMYNERLVREYQQNNHSRQYQKHPESHIPVPTAEDYESKYIIRYFVKYNSRKTNPIIEVNDKTFKKTSEDFYKKCEMKWKISGPEKTITKDGIVIDKGISSANRDLIKLKTRTFPGLDSYLKDLTELAYTKVDKKDSGYKGAKNPSRKSVYGSGTRPKSQTSGPAEKY